MALRLVRQSEDGKTQAYVRQVEEVSLTQKEVELVAAAARMYHNAIARVIEVEKGDFTWWVFKNRRQAHTAVLQFRKATQNVKSVEQLERKVIEVGKRLRNGLISIRSKDPRPFKNKIAQEEQTLLTFAENIEEHLPALIKRMEAFSNTIIHLANAVDVAIEEIRKDPRPKNNSYSITAKNTHTEITADLQALATNLADLHNKEIEVASEIKEGWE